MAEPENGAYSRRRIDELNDGRIKDLGRELGLVRDDVKELDKKVDGLSTRLAWIAGGLAVLSVAVNIFGPIIASRFLS